MSTNNSWESKMMESFKRYEESMRELEALADANRSAAVTLSLKDLEELSMMATRVRLISMKLSIGHRDNNTTAMDDMNFSKRLDRFKQTLTEIHDYYAKEH